MSAPSSCQGKMHVWACVVRERVAVYRRRHGRNGAPDGRDPRAHFNHGIKHVT